MLSGSAANGTLLWAAASVGVRSRIAAEDRLGVFDRGPAGLYVVLADGAGGRPGGARAAERCVGRARTLFDTPAALDLAGWCAFVGDLDVALDEDPLAGEAAVLGLTVGTHAFAGARAGDVAVFTHDADGTRALTPSERGGERAGSLRASPEPLSGPWSGSLLLGTDGWWRHPAAREDLARTAHLPVDEAVEALVAGVTSPAGERWDDVTVVLVRRAQP